ncbi:GfV-C18-ORF1 [Ichnoviriform fumiferanae]|uniref:GfV-C18-ORF1 n=1 Tax=Ichnoviriform fumiferanae TaxID=419435 RepID=A2PZY5_9VIRU|nr:GfV-C18-ORF1 [Ichnoviriform fumiferanae]BAF45557.1 GfV-C18-ORF1 [Ichnoviriform fumiferanae]
MGNVFSTKKLSTNDVTYRSVSGELNRNNNVLPDIIPSVSAVCDHPIRECWENNMNNMAEARSLEVLSINVCNIAENRTKNRCQLVPCLDHSRVVLSTSNDSNNSDYIHANYIDGFKLKKKFIATQAPISGKTVNDFYNMIWENNCEIIVVLAKFFDNEENVFDPYWPMSVGLEVRGKYKFFTRRIDVRASYAKYFLLIENITTMERPRSISLYQYLNWPQHGVPLDIFDFLSFLMVINAEALERFFTSSRMGPIVVHGNAGIGRTGTFCALDVCLEEWHETHATNVLDTVKRIRRQRYMSITTADQCAFIFCALEILKKLNMHLKY